MLEYEKEIHNTENISDAFAGKFWQSRKKFIQKMKSELNKKGLQEHMRFAQRNFLGTVVKLCEREEFMQPSESYHVSPEFRKRIETLKEKRQRKLNYAEELMDEELEK